MFAKADLEKASQSYYNLNARLAVYAPDALGHDRAKTAEGVLRYAQNPVVAVLDASKAGSSVKEVTGINSDAPILGSMEEVLALKPDALLLGTAWSGGALPASWKPDIKKAISAGLDIINGLHDFLSEDPELSQLAMKHNVKLLDVRRSPENLPVGGGLVMKLDSYVMLTVGSDCSVGKMTATLEILKAAVKQKKKASFVATGQTGIMISGKGIAIDRVIGDFMSGAVEQMILEEARLGSEYILVEGQGSIVHPSFSGVTAALMHGACPQGLILCHNARRSKIKGLDEYDLLPLAELIVIYEKLCSYLRPAKVLGVALNTFGMKEEEALAFIEKTKKDLMLPVCDPVREGAEILFEAIVKHRESLK